MIAPETIKKLASGYLADIIAIRRHLHAHPELSFKEFETAAYVAGRLKEYGIPYHEGIAGTGIVAIIEGTEPASKVLALRADLDALPIKEENNVEYCSKNEGVMHACGHDVHTASLLGAARILNQLRADWKGTIKLIFQPGEEKLPGGAQIMINEGVLENPSPSAIIGQHVLPSLATGKVGFRSGMYMASTDELYLTVKGKGGHAALVDQYINPLLIASRILRALDAEFMDIKKRNIPEIPTVLAFGKILGYGATNVIPDEVKLEGTFRTMNENWRNEAHRIMKNMAERIAEEMGGKCEFNIVRGYPFLVNDEKVTSRCKANAIKFLGKENVVDLEMRMTAEDFAYYSQVLPACFYRLGTGNVERGITSGLHTPTFDVDESSLETAMGLMAWLAIKELS